MVTWEVICANILAIITNGGTAGMFWGFLIVVVGYLLVYASIAEMSSMVSISPLRGPIEKLRQQRCTEEYPGLWRCCESRPLSCFR